MKHLEHQEYQSPLHSLDPAVDSASGLGSAVGLDPGSGPA